jgi:hypothetical protein
VQAKLSTTGAPKTSLITARDSGSSVSPVAVTASGAMRKRPARCSAASRASIEGYPYSTGACKAFSRCTIWGSGRVTGTFRNRNGMPAPAVSAGAAPVMWTAEAAATMATGKPPGGGPPSARTRASSGRVSDKAYVTPAAGSRTTTPRWPVLPPLARAR